MRKSALAKRRGDKWYESAYCQRRLLRDEIQCGCRCRMSGKCGCEWCSGMLKLRPALRDKPAAITLWPVMKRLTLIFLMLLLPLQSAWAAASAYCQHEQGVATQHFGHHAHQHQTATDSNDGGGKSPLSVHADCSSCHLSCPAATASVRSIVVMTSGSPVLAEHPDALSSVFPDSPERPKWAPAA